MARFAGEAEHRESGQAQPRLCSVCMHSQCGRMAHQIANIREPILISSGLPGLHVDDVKACQYQ